MAAAAAAAADARSPASVLPGGSAASGLSDLLICNQTYDLRSFSTELLLGSSNCTGTLPVVGDVQGLRLRQGARVVVRESGGPALGWA